MAHWSASWPTLSIDSSRRRTQQYDSFSVDLAISRMHSSASTGCECLKGLFSRSPCRLMSIGFSPWRCPAVHIRRFTCTDRRHPVTIKTVVFFIRRSTRSCCQTAYYWTSRLPWRRHSHMERLFTGRCYLSTVSSHLQKTTKTVVTASV